MLVSCHIALEHRSELFDGARSFENLEKWFERLAMGLQWGSDGGKGKNNLCDLLSFVEVCAWKIYLNNRFKSSRELFSSFLV